MLELQEHSLKLVDYIKQKIKLSKYSKITFAEYMEYALYAKDLGYYANNIVHKFGEQGDFITAPMLGDLFASCIVNQFSDIKFNNIFNQKFNILELGSGNGKLAYQVVKLIKNSKNNFLKTNFNNYLILETSKELIKQQQRFLLTSDLSIEDQNKFIWVDNLPKNFNGIILANEVLDALPVHLFKICNKKIYEKFVTIDSNNNFKLIDVPAKKAFAKKIMNLSIEHNLYSHDFNHSYNSEICLKIPDFIKDLAISLNKGAIFLCDYGFLSSEYYHTDRYLGTLMCHYRHIAHHDPFYLPGLQDITAHVDFSSVIDNAMNYNLILERFSSLAKFLIDSNIENFFHEKYKNILNTTINHHQLNKEINTLISPNEMGEIFKVAVFTKH